jgi:hypothetical protein
MRLQRYLSKLYAIIESRREIEVERLFIDESVPGQNGMIEGRLRFWDASLLEFVEILATRDFVLIKTDYAYHYQSKAGQLIFRYDNAPHHPEVHTHPHHKHSVHPRTNVESIEPASPPHLADVL